MKFEEEPNIERLKIIYGFRIGAALVALFGVLAFTIALGKVRAETSYGLGMALGGLNTAIGSFANWAWQTRHTRNLSVIPKPDTTAAVEGTEKAA